MKKLLVLALVLSMATMASATLTVSISGATELAYGATGTYTISYAITGATGEVVAADQDILATLGTIDGGVIVVAPAVPARSALDLVGINPVSGDYEIGVMNDNSNTALGSPLATFVYTAPLAGVYGAIATLSLVENAYLDLTWTQITGADLVLVGTNVTLTPEPITMALLGLGGLFLRRRSK